MALSLTGGNRHDVTQLMPLLDAIPRIRGVRGRPRHRPGRPFAGRGYDYDTYRRLLRARGITPKFARKGTAHGPGPADRPCPMISEVRAITALGTRSRTAVSAAVFAAPYGVTGSGKQDSA